MYPHELAPEDLYLYTMYIIIATDYSYGTVTTVSPVRNVSSTVDTVTTLAGLGPAL